MSAGESTGTFGLRVRSAPVIVRGEPLARAPAKVGEWWPRLDRRGRGMIADGLIAGNGLRPGRRLPCSVDGRAYLVPVEAFAS
jgi:hypothetical protein